MPVCSVSQNAPAPAWLMPFAQAGIAVTPPMQQWAATLANDLSVPLNSVHAAWFGGQPIAALVNCHAFTVNPDGSQTAGAYHGASLYLITDPAHYPPAPGGAAPVDWPIVAGTGVVLACVVGAFFLALKGAGRAAR